MFPEKTHFMGLGRSKSKAAPPPRSFFLDFWQKILGIAHPVNYSYLPPWSIPGPNKNFGIYLELH